MKFLESLLAPKKRTLLLLTESDIDAMSPMQKREIAKGQYAVALFSRQQVERIRDYGGVKVDAQFQRIGALVSAVKAWEPLPDRILTSNALPQAGLMDRELTRAFLDADTQLQDFTAFASGQGRSR